jgi:hypothetical protein
MKKESARYKFLEKAKADVVNGMDSGAFHDKYKSHKYYDEDDWLFLRNFFCQSNYRQINQNQQP